MFNFTPREYFEADEAIDREVPQGPVLSTVHRRLLAPSLSPCTNRSPRTNGAARAPHLGFVLLVVGSSSSPSTSCSAAASSASRSRASSRSALSCVSYFNSDKVALAAEPRQAGRRAPSTRRYHNLVEGLCIASGLPKPRLYIVDDPAPNAFATGRNPQARGARGHHRPAREDEPGRARRRARARAAATSRTTTSSSRRSR